MKLSIIIDFTMLNFSDVTSMFPSHHVCNCWAIRNVLYRTDIDVYCLCPYNIFRLISLAH